jgi:ankyrin repeat protein
LAVAARYNRAGAVRKLIEAGAPVDGRTEDGLSPLMLASSGTNDPEVITVLIRVFDYHFCTVADIPRCRHPHRRISEAVERTTTGIALRRKQ